MDKRNLTIIFNQYITRFEELNAVDIYDEGYKWYNDAIKAGNNIAATLQLPSDLTGKRLC